MKDRKKFNIQIDKYKHKEEIWKGLNQFKLKKKVITREEGMARSIASACEAETWFKPAGKLFTSSIPAYHKNKLFRF